MVNGFAISLAATSARSVVIWLFCITAFVCSWPDVVRNTLSFRVRARAVRRLLSRCN